MVTWNDQTNAKLLKAIIKKAKLTKADYESLATIIGDECTPKAVRNHIYRLVKDGDDVTPESNLMKPSDKIGTPNGKPSKSPGKPGKSPAGKRRKVFEMREEVDDDHNGMSPYPVRDMTPTPKKVKMENGLKKNI